MVGQLFGTVLTCDDLEFLEGRREKRIGEARSITSALIFVQSGIGAVPLFRYVWYHCDYPLSPELVAEPAVNHDLDERVSIRLISV